MPTLIQCAIAQTIRGCSDMQDWLDYLYALTLLEFGND